MLISINFKFQAEFVSVHVLIQSRLTLVHFFLRARMEGEKAQSVFQIPKHPRRCPYRKNQLRCPRKHAPWCYRHLREWLLADI